MAILLEDLLKKIPAETAGRVDRARDRLNQPIRDALRHETGLRLNRPTQDKDPNAVSAKAENCSIRISVEPGLPVSLRGKLIESENLIAALLAPIQRNIRQLLDSSQCVAEVIAGLPENPRITAVIDGRDKHLLPVAALAEDLLKEAEKFNLVQWILEVDEDVLGVYSYSPTRSNTEECREGQIRLYWAVIGLVSRILYISLDDLTAVVLSHELAHAYTHIGSDIDGERWPNSVFAESEHALKEGLAQYYTQAACRKIERLAPGSHAAYEELLRHQPEAYQSHMSWVTEFTPEEVRFAVIETRRGGPGEMKAFESALKEAGDKLRRRSRKDGETLQDNLLF